MTPKELLTGLDRTRIKATIDTMSVEARQLEVMAAERDVSRFLAGKNPPSALAARKLAEIIVRDRLPHEEVGTAFVADPTGFELACRGPLGRLKYRLSGAFDRALTR